MCVKPTPEGVLKLLFWCGMAGAAALVAIGKSEAGSFLVVACVFWLAMGYAIKLADEAKKPT